MTLLIKCTNFLTLQRLEYCLYVCISFKSSCELFETLPCLGGFLYIQTKALNKGIDKSNKSIDTVVLEKKSLRQQGGTDILR